MLIGPSIVPEWMGEVGFGLMITGSILFFYSGVAAVSGIGLLMLIGGSYSAGLSDGFNRGVMLNRAKQVTCKKRGS